MGPTLAPVCGGVTRGPGWSLGPEEAGDQGVRGQACRGHLGSFSTPAEGPSLPRVGVWGGFSRLVTRVLRVTVWKAELTRGLDPSPSSLYAPGCPTPIPAQRGNSVSLPQVASLQSSVLGGDRPQTGCGLGQGWRTQRLCPGLRSAQLPWALGLRSSQTP